MALTTLKQSLKVALIPIAFAIQFSCAGANPPAGGPCTYSKFSGSAEVIELKPGQNGYWMIFKATFTGAQPTSAFYNPNSDSAFVSNPSGDTTPEWLTSKGIVIGAKFEMNLSLVSSGSCAPVIHEFPSLPGITH